MIKTMSGTRRSDEVARKKKMNTNLPARKFKGLVVAEIGLCVFLICLSLLVGFLAQIDQLRERAYILESNLHQLHVELAEKTGGIKITDRVHRGY